MRGRRHAAAASAASSRNTPADAGTTGDVGPRCCHGSEHPRGCGDDRQPRPGRGWTGGTPPRMRGRRPGLDCGGAWGRNTPADAGTTRVPSGTPSGTPEHPRGCGDDVVVAGEGRLVAGTPPRMRGRRRESAAIAGERGNTPADAGTTTGYPPARRCRTEHPRGCGDDRVASRNASTLAGTPPRMRGRRDLGAGLEREHRNTPADAGTTRKIHGSPTVGAEHPRGCGDDLDLNSNTDATWGTPPRMRGRLTDAALVLATARNTPADAGTTRGPGLSAPPVSEHPRGCGDDSGNRRLRQATRGTPPRMRGRQFDRDRLYVHERNTPADAGTTHRRGNAPPTASEHPRGCGDDRRYRGDHGKLRGTPPRMRGRPQMLPVVSPGGRNTPADAGTTSGRSWPPNIRWEHPRGCGDDRPLPREQGIARGTPPRMRGRRACLGVGGPVGRNTPADAGTTGFVVTGFKSDQEHPRGCGDDPRCFPSSRPVGGTPPRMRGRQVIDHLHLGRGRNTPADAGTTEAGGTNSTAIGEHPRGCGDDPASSKLGRSMDGTPPRMRGRRRMDMMRSEGSRNTPADAGTTRVTMQMSRARSEHPRGCGDDGCREQLCCGRHGTPPRMRGRRYARVPRPTHRRNTPADAGTTAGWVSGGSGRAEHPRGCGDDPASDDVPTAVEGTPPRMRGRRRMDMMRSGGSRNTPADAGTTRRDTADPHTTEEHPRGCGDDPALRARSSSA